MSRRVWLLVEWVEENNAFSSCEIVHVDSFSFRENDLQPGKEIFISLKNKDPRRAKVIRISDNKRQVKEHKDFLERQDQQIKNVLQLCMRTIKDMKSNQYPSSLENTLQQNAVTVSQQSGLSHVITASSENSASESDAEVNLVEQQTHQSKITKFVTQTRHQNIRYEPKSYKKETKSPAVNQRRRSIISSTPLPGKSVQENLKLCFDQATQTDNAWLQPSTAKIEEIELVLKHLYGRFQSLVMRVNSATVTNRSVDMPESEQNCEVSYVEQNDSWITPNNAVEHSRPGYNTVEDNNVTAGDVGAEQIIEHDENNQYEDFKNAVKIEAARKNSHESTRVRRMSAQTTYSNEMVPIGNGHAMVPARLLNDIDWTSHTTATRQLLQAIFPRKVLATHSLTGKQSPAHLNKPAKKLLNPYLVEDIIITVSTKSGVPQNLVRNTITVKCTDEAKLYRNRQRNRLTRSEKKRLNNENVPPSLTQSSDES